VPAGRSTSPSGAAYVWSFSRSTASGWAGAMVVQPLPASCTLTCVTVTQISSTAGLEASNIISMGNILRVQGRPGLGLLFMASGNFLNAILAAWAIFGLHLGVAGAAAATALSVAASFAALLAFVQSRSSHLHVRRRDLAPLVADLPFAAVALFLLRRAWRRLAGQPAIEAERAQHAAEA
jgi:hypothetical protein